jgi:hypothetical protein
MTMPIPPLATQAGETQSVTGPTPEQRPGPQRPPGLRLVKTNAGLLISPMIIVGGALALYLNYQWSDKIFQDIRALDWDRNLRPQLEQHLSITLWATLFTILI